MFNCEFSPIKKFSNLKNKNAHLLKFHKIDNRKLGIKCNESECGHLFSSINQLIDHLENNHQKSFERINLEFGDRQGRFILSQFFRLI